MLIPRNKEDSTKSKIIEILSRDWPLTLKEIFYKIKKVYGKNITYQAIFKAVNELIKEGAILKLEKSYKLNVEWLNSLEKFSKKISMDYSQKDSKPIVEVNAGFSQNQDAFLAGKEAAEKALANIIHYKENIQLVLVFSSISYENNFNLVLQGIKSITSEAKMIGLTTFGEIMNNRLSDSIEVIIFAAEKENFSVTSDFVDIGQLYNNKSSLIKKSKEFVKNININDSDFAFLFFPGPSKANGMTNIAPNFIDIIKPMLPNNLPIIGGVAADDGKLIKTYQFFDGNFYSDAIIFAAIKTNVNFSITAEHGYSKFNNKEYFFKLKNNLIEKIATSKDKGLFKSAVEVYAKELDLDINVLKSLMPYFSGPGQKFKEWIKLTAFARKSNPHVLSYPFNIYNDILAFTGELHEKEPMIMMDTNSNNLISSFNSALRKSIENLNETPQIILAFPCAIFNVMIIAAQNEIKAFKSGKFSDITITGAYVNGEIGPYNKKNIDFCNGSVTCLAIGKKQIKN